MRKAITCAIILSLMLSLAACNNSSTNTSPPSNTGGNTEDVSNTQSPTTPEAGNEIIIPEMNPPMPLPEYPIIDGSSSTATMHAAIQSHLTYEVVTDITHSKTYDALERLIPGSDNPADVLLSVKYYDDTLQDAKNRGANLIITPIAKEGFVFIVHRDNPVDSLTQQQLRDIYSGEITNWKEVGGKDEEILTVQRNRDSGSQTAMNDFMGDIPLVSDDESLYAGTMGSMLDAISINGSAAIGYNMYSWTMDQSTVGQSLGDMWLKTLAIENVKPSNKTLADNSYPLLVYTYSYYDKNNAKGKALTDWLLTAEGQKAIADAGYVGIFGEVPPDKPRTFIDRIDSQETAIDFYLEEGWYPGYVYAEELITDQEQIEAFSIGKSKDVTFLWLYHCGREDASYVLRFIALTRERGGMFEVINEGEVPEL